MSSLRNPLSPALLFFPLSLLLLLGSGYAQPPGGKSPALLPLPGNGAGRIVEGLKVQLDSTRLYDPSYATIAYPGGDVPLSTGVCADVVVRAFRHAGIDLQVEIHDDMRRNFRAYPQLWGLSRADRNIDHRRVANQMRFFERKGKKMTAGNDSSKFLPGDIVAWRLPGNRYHVGVVTNVAARTGRPMMAHNIGRGAELHDCLFTWEIIGHYRWFQ